MSCFDNYYFIPLNVLSCGTMLCNLCPGYVTDRCQCRRKIDPPEFRSRSVYFKFDAPGEHIVTGPGEVLISRTSDENDPCFYEITGQFHVSKALSV